ncbi:prophage Qin DNA packaging protein NU1-like protein [Escherichia coli]|nr:prophage Qin DNA packaging protein NU1-like protein [Escherichia coli]STF77650.1 prophage Qin DNA packaging protein NU1-like protein [Escherichia coli]
MATQTEVARHLSLTDRQLRRLQKLPGAPISNKRGQLDLDAWRDFYISYLRRSKNDVPDGDSEDDYEEKLLIARWELTAEQAVTQQLKNEVSKGKLIDTGFGNDSNLLIVFYVQIMPDDFVMQLHRF